MSLAIILLNTGPIQSSINPVSSGKATGQKACIHAGLRPFGLHSHSVPWLLSQLFSMLFGAMIRKIPTQFQRYFDFWRIRVLFVYRSFRHPSDVKNSIKLNNDDLCYHIMGMSFFLKVHAQIIILRPFQRNAYISNFSEITLIYLLLSEIHLYIYENIVNIVDFCRRVVIL